MFQPNTINTITAFNEQSHFLGSTWSILSQIEKSLKFGLFHVQNVLTYYYYYYSSVMLVGNHHHHQPVRSTHQYHHHFCFVSHQLLFLLLLCIVVAVSSSSSSEDKVHTSIRHRYYPPNYPHNENFNHNNNHKYKNVKSKLSTTISPRFTMLPHPFHSPSSFHAMANYSGDIMLAAVFPIHERDQNFSCGSLQVSCVYMNEF